MDKHIKFMDRIYHAFNGSKKEFERVKKLNEKKQRYYINTFVYNQKCNYMYQASRYLVMYVA